MAVKNIGGFMRDSVPKGTEGVVLESGWGVLRVKFTQKRMFLGDKSVVIEVNADEIR